VGRDEMEAEISGNTNSMTGDVDIACGATAMPGNDAVYRVYLFVGEELTAEMTADADDMSLFVLYESPSAQGATCADQTLAGCADNLVTAGTETVSYTATASGWYDILVDSRWTTNFGRGPFTIVLSIYNPLPGQCYAGTTPGACTEEDMVYFDWDDANEIVSPMTAGVSGEVSGMTRIRTTAAYSGSATHRFLLPCTDTWYAWGLVRLDSDLPDANTFGYDVDGATAQTWKMDAGADNWSWDQLTLTDAVTPWSAELLGGSHTLVVTGGAIGVDTYYYPLLGYIIFSNNPDYVPPADPEELD
jgi:hypothetical protein